MSRKPTGAKKIMGGKKKSKTAYNLADPLPKGEILSDLTKGQWVIGGSVGCGGFGMIYLANPVGNGPAGANCRYVVKVEPISNGPLFSELSFYTRCAKEHQIEQFRQSKKLKKLGMPRFVASGQHSKEKERYRFMVMDRYKTDIQKLFEQNDKRFTEKVAYTLAIQMIEVLEYIHSHSYAHADIKASNMLLGIEAAPETENQAYLVDYGLAAKFAMDGKHKVYKEDPKRCHDGTIEFTSIDAHKGVSPSRRGDLEILAYCLVQWLVGQLPWEDKLANKDYVRDQKIKCMSDIPGFLKKCSLTAHTELQKYLSYVKTLKYEAEPNYKLCIKLFQDAIKRLGYENDGKLNFSKNSSSKRSKRKSQHLEQEKAEEDETPQQVSKRKKAISKNTSEASTSSASPVNKSQNASTSARKPARKVQSPRLKQSPRVKQSPRQKQSPKQKQSVNGVVSDSGRALQSATNWANSVGVEIPALEGGVKKSKRKKILKQSVGVQTSPGLKGLMKSKPRK